MRIARTQPFILAAAFLAIVSSGSSLSAQTTVATGSIVGTVADPSGAVIAGASITIANVATGQRFDLATNSSGAFNSGALIPGNYKTQVSAKGFSSAETTVSVLVGNTATLNIALQIGGENQVIEVQSSTLQVNREQPTVQGVLNEQQIENLLLTGKVSEHDAVIGRHLARVVTGGECSPVTPVTEQHVLDLEREAFLSLAGMEKSQDRMQAILMTGKPLRN